jgi:hypothetical protein
LPLGITGILFLFANFKISAISSSFSGWMTISAIGLGKRNLTREGISAISWL